MKIIFTIISILAALFLCVFNTVASVIIIRRSIRKDTRRFTKIALTSMVVRFFLVLILVWVGISIIGFEMEPFIFTFLISCFFLLMFEVLYINKLSKKRKFEE